MLNSIEQFWTENKTIIDNFSLFNSFEYFLNEK